jgi:8-oxo-dGTP pyrophosphatase MutT (NUDIX family)
MEEVECSFVSGNKWFRLRACGILIDGGKVLMVRNDRDPYYYSVGGAIRHGETTEDAAIREVWEETGVKFEIDRLAFIHENFFLGNRNSIFEGLSCHEVAFYYLMKWEPNCTVNDSNLTLDGLQENLVWLDIGGLANTDLVVYPEFFAKELKEISLAPKHIVTIE